MSRPVLVRLGYWLGADAPGWPDPRSFVDQDWDSDERDEVTSYVRRGLVARRYMGPSLCRLCGTPVGSLELSDGTFIWPEGFAHYISEHSVRPPQRFLEHIREQTTELEEADVEDDWWRLIVE
jgi:hypothetical protein